MDITLTYDNGSFILSEADRQSLMASILITPKYKGQEITASYDLQALDASAVQYTPQDITDKKAELQKIIDDAQAQIDVFVAIEKQAASSAAVPAEVTP